MGVVGTITSPRPAPLFSTGPIVMPKPSETLIWINDDGSARAIFSHPSGWALLGLRITRAKRGDP
jgi:hypothetical protein